MVQNNFEVLEADAGQRLDRWLAALPELDCSRTQVQRWIQAGCVACNGEIAAKNQHPVQTGEKYVVSIPVAEPGRLQPVDLNLKVIYADEHLAVLHKPAGIATHPGPGDTQTTIAHGILHIWQDIGNQSREKIVESTPGKILRPGIVHRLDRDTEGLLIVALHDGARRKLMLLFEKRQIKKEYLAWLSGKLPSSSGRIELAIGRHPVQRTKMRVHPNGRMAITEYQQLEMIQSIRGRRYYKVRLNIHTGRTHQIRVHMAHLGAPVIGDRQYSRSAAKYERFGMLLLAQKLGFIHPLTGEHLEFFLPEPERFGEFQNMAPKL